jgi:hypothetical protein
MTWPFAALVAQFRLSEMVSSHQLAMRASSSTPTTEKRILSRPVPRYVRNGAPLTAGSHEPRPPNFSSDPNGKPP